MMNTVFPVAATIIISLGVCAALAAYFLKREQHLLRRLQKMLDDALEGKFEDIHLDESKISLIENSMWRYLCDRQVSYQNLLREKEQMQVLISDISHQTETPIANILLYSQLLEEGCGFELKSNGTGEDREAGEELLAIREQAEKLDFLMECLIKLSRLETGLIRVNLKKQSVNAVLSAVRRQFHSKAAQKKMELFVKNTQETAVFDLKWTIEAVANLVDNAIKYTPCKGRVSLDVTSYPFFVRIDITDNGPGIPEPEHSAVFTRFYRSSSASNQPGLGIGLYLAREVAKAQNGYMKLTSRPGEGSVFSLFLPRETMSQK